MRPFPNVQDGRSQISTERRHPRGVVTRRTRAVLSRQRWSLDFREGASCGRRRVCRRLNRSKILNSKYYLGASLLGLDLRAYDIAPDGRFLMIKDLGDPKAAAALASMVIVLELGRSS